MAGEADLEQTKKDLENWREVLLPLNKILHWEQTYYPFAIIGAATVLFAIIWQMEPSLLTALSLLGLFVTLLDFGVPTLCSSLGATAPDGQRDHEFEDVCRRIVHFKRHVADFCNNLLTLKKERPINFYARVVVTLLALAWIGDKVDNLFLGYLAVVGLLLTPGLRHHNVLHRYIPVVIVVFKRLVFGIKEPLPGARREKEKEKEH